MHEFEIQMSPEDHIVLESYKTLLDGLADYLGSGYELVLHSLENLDCSAIKVINGFHTGRKEGAPITELALQMLQRINSQGGQDFITYHSVNSAGKPLRSTTMAIRGKTFSGTQLRSKLGLRSTAFEITVSGNTITVTTRGFGHRVGMSQYGAQAMAKTGSGFAEILAHYYTGAELCREED